MHGAEISRDQSTEPLRDRGEQTPAEIARPASSREASSFEHQRILGRVLANMFGKVGHIEIADRYRVLERLGAGGMGEVYLCDDLELQRQVAVKHVRGAGTQDDQRRLLREARAQARLTHANVVRVYDAGTHEGRTFLAMEYVEGQTLASWLAKEERSTRELLQHYVAAGRGLAAAHHANIVHRDFKPENVLIGVDGTVRVADFGLAIASRERDEFDGAKTAATGSMGGESTLSTAVSGGVRGTIRYMSLEHLCGREVDARSDQFSFCLALHEALWGAPPFDASSVSARRAALEAGEPLAPTSLRALWRILRRGLMRDPALRWPDMDALLDALDGLPRRRRWIVASFAAVASLGVGLGATQLAGGDPCADSARDLDGVWSVETKTELGERLGALEVSHAAHSWRLVERGLDRWAADWTAQRTELCRAREGLRVEPDRLRTHDLCLTRQLREIETFVAALASADSSVLAEAAVTVAELPAPSDCEAEFAASNFEPPSKAIAIEVEDLRVELGEARSLRWLGRVDEALRVATRADERATQLGYGPLQAEAKAELAMAEDVAGSPRVSRGLYDEAIDLAETHHHDRLLPELWIERAELSLFELRSDRALAEPFLHRAAIAHERNGGPDARARARLSFNDGRVAELAGDEDLARTNYRRAVDEASAADAPELASYLGSLAGLVDARDGLELRARAVDLTRERYGPRHPRTAKAIFDHGAMLHEVQGSGREQLELAADIWREDHGRPHSELASAHYALGALALEAGDLSGARHHADEAARIFAAVLEPDDWHHGLPLQLLAQLAGVEADHQLALEYARRAASFLERSKDGERDERAIAMRNEAANQLIELGRLDEAEAELELLVARLGTNAEREGPVRLRLLELSLRRGQLERADTQLRAVELLDAKLGGQQVVFDVLRAVVDHRSGRALVLDPKRAEAIVEALGADVVETWLEDLGVSEAERAELGFQAN